MSRDSDLTLYVRFNNVNKLLIYIYVYIYIYKSTVYSNIYEWIDGIYI